MGINRKIVEKYKVAYQGLQEIVPAISIPGLSMIDEYDEWWLPVSGRYVPGVREGMYEISTYGRVFTHIKSPFYPNGGIMMPSINAHGYLQINLLSVDGRKICCKISRLVMLHFKFIPGCHIYEVDHKNGDKLNNRIWNLEWVTPQENVHRAINNGLRPISCTSDSTVLLTNEQAYELYGRALNGESYTELSLEYGVSYDYVSDLVKGTIRPYIANKFYKDHNHIEWRES